MKRIGPPDSHYLSASEGWLELGNFDEACRELEKVSSALRDHPDVLKLQRRVYARSKNWMAAMDVARTVWELGPNDLIDRVSLGCINETLEPLPEERDSFSPLAARLPLFFAIPYNLACFACQLGNLDEAWDWLEVAFEVSDRHEIRRLALNDPDLQPLWGRLEKL